MGLLSGLHFICELHWGGKQFLCLDPPTCYVSPFSSEWVIALPLSVCADKLFASREQGVFFFFFLVDHCSLLPECLV